MTSPPAPDPIIRLSRAFQESRILLSAVELRLFDHLNHDPLTFEELANAAGISLRGAEILLNALAALGFVTKTADRFANAPLAAAYLVTGSPTNMLGIVDHSVNLWDRWSELTEIVRSGQPALHGRETGSLEAFILAMHGFARGRVKAVIDQIDLTGVTSVLDIGGGPGTYACEFARRKGDLTATVFDFPDVLVITRRIAAEAGLADRVQTMRGDVLEDDIGSGYDLIFISALIHSNDPDETRLIFRKAFAALNPGGQVVVQEFLLDDTKTQPASAAIFSVNMLVGTVGGRSYRETEVREWLAEAGFVDICRRDPDEFAGLVIGRRP